MSKTLDKMHMSDVVDSCFNNFLYMSGGGGRQASQLHQNYK